MPYQDPLRLGAEHQANLTVAGDQNDPAIVLLEGGGYVVAWADTAGEAIRARLFTADARPVGGELTLSTGGLSAQGPVVAALPGGGFVAAWTDFQGDADGAGVLVRRFDAAGQPLGAPVTANVQTAGQQTAPALAILSDGFVLTWTGTDADGAGIRARRFDGAGQPVGDEVAVNATTAGAQGAAVVTGIAGGGFGVAWTGPDSDGTGILTRSFGPDGAPLFGFDIPVNQGAAGTQGAPTLAALPGGNAVLAWTSTVNGASTVRLRTYDADARAWNPESGLLDADPGSSDPSVAALADGGFVVTWTAVSDGNSSGIAARLFGADGIARGDAFRVNADAEAYQGSPVVTGLAGDGFAVAWIDNRASGTLEIRTQAFGFQDAPEGAVTLAGEPTRGQTLSAATGDLRDQDGLGPFSYRWERSDGGNGWAAIEGATAEDYVAGRDDVGRQVRVHVSYVDNQGTAEGVDSAAATVAARAVAVSAVREGVARIDLDSAGLARLLADRDVLVVPEGAATVALVDGGLNYGEATATAFVVRLYEGLLERSADAAGLSYWTHALGHGAGRVGVVAGMLGGGEYAVRHDGEDARTFVGHLYEGLLGRQAEAGGLDYWAGRLDAGLSRAALTADFAESGEARARWREEALGVFTPDLEAGIVRAAYGVLGREADAGAIAHFRAALEGGAGLGALGDALEGSGEFRARYGALDDRAFVEGLFRDVLGREADAAGRDYFVGLLGRGAADRGDVVAGLAASGEAQAHLTWALPYAAEPESGPQVAMIVETEQVWLT